MTSENSPSDAEPLTQLRRHALYGAGTVVLLLTALVCGAFLIEVDSAVIAQGTITPTDGTQEIAHPLGGVAESILVSDGDRVEAGDQLLVLRTENEDAARDALTRQLAFASVRIDRLRFESQETTADFTLSDSTKARFARDLLNEASTVETATLAERSTSIEAQVDQLQSTIDLSESQLRELLLEATELDGRIGAYEAELTAASSAQPASSIQVASATQVLESAREQRGQLAEREATLRQSISSFELRVVQLHADQRASTLTELQVALQAAAQLEAQVAAIAEVHDAAVITAPVDGVVFGSILDTVNGVVPAGATLMKISPSLSDLTLQVRISPRDIDIARSSTTARVVLPSFNQNSTPQLSGTVVSIAPDTTVDPLTGESFYTAQLIVDARDAHRISSDIDLIPGMTAEVFIETGTRTIFSYLISPLEDRLRHTFREE